MSEMKKNYEHSFIIGKNMQTYIKEELFML